MIGRPSGTSRNHRRTEPQPHPDQALVDPMNLDPLLAEDLAEGHQRPKLERHGEALFLVLHPPFYIDSIEDVAFVEAEVIKQRNCVVPTLIGSIYSMNFDNMPELH